MTGREDKVSLEIVDVPGKFSSVPVAKQYLKKADACVIVYDCTKPESLERAKFWIKVLKDEMREGIMIFVIANKTDLETEVLLDAEA